MIELALTLLIALAGVGVSSEIYNEAMDRSLARELGRLELDRCREDAAVLLSDDSRGPHGGIGWRRQ